MGEMTESNRARSLQLMAAIIIGGTPIWTVLFIWDFSDRQGGWPIFVRSNSLVAPMIELIIVLIVMATGFSPLQAIKKLPIWTKVALAFWLPITIATSFRAGNDHLLAILGFMKLFCAALFLLALIELRRKCNGSFFAATWFAIGCAVPVYILLWLIQMAITNPTGNDWITQIPGVNNIRHVGHFAFAGFFAGVASLILLRNDASVFRRWCVPVFFSSLGLALALWTGSRGPVLAVASGITVTIFVGSGFRRELGLFFAATTIIAATAVINLPVPHPIYGITGATGIADMEADASHDASSGRTQLWQGTTEKIQQKPFFGWGLEQFSAFGPDETIGMMHPHNYPLQLLFSGGFVSALLAALMAFPALRSWRWPFMQDIGLVGTGCVAGIIVYSMYDGALFFSYPIMIFLLAIASAVHPQEMLSEPDKSDSPDLTKSGKVTK